MGRTWTLCPPACRACGLRRASGDSSGTAVALTRPTPWKAIACSSEGHPPGNPVGGGQGGFRTLSVIDPPGHFFAETAEHPAFLASYQQSPCRGYPQPHLSTSYTLMTPAETFCVTLYSTHAGRVPVSVGLRKPFNKVYPLVFESPAGVPLGLVGCAWNQGAPPDLVQLYHVSAFHPRSGAGRTIMVAVCALADRLQVRITTQPELIGAGVPGWELPDDGEAALLLWYARFGFVPAGNLHLERKPAPRD